MRPRRYDPRRHIAAWEASFIASAAVNEDQMPVFDELSADEARALLLDAEHALAVHQLIVAKIRRHANGRV